MSSNSITKIIGKRAELINWGTKLERLQAKALKAIYGYEPSYGELMARADLTTLRARREERELRFARRCADSARFSKWFPKKDAGITRGTGPYVEEFARCCRCYNSPIFSMRRKLNKEIRSSGAREGGAAEALRTARAQAGLGLALG